MCFTPSMMGAQSVLAYDIDLKRECFLPEVAQCSPMMKQKRMFATYYKQWLKHATRHVAHVGVRLNRLIVGCS